jgi:hypothetical protein
MHALLWRREVGVYIGGAPNLAVWVKSEQNPAEQGWNVVEPVSTREEPH